MATFFGAKYVGSLNANQEQVFKTLPVASGVTVTAGDFVFMTAGRVTSASPAGVRLLGVAQHTVTGNAGGTNKVLVDVTPNALYAVENDNDTETFVAAHVGEYFDIIGATGAQYADTSSSSTTPAQLYCWEFNPDSPYTYGDTDNSIGIFSIAERTYSV
jgi:hypothetical protein